MSRIRSIATFELLDELVLLIPNSYMSQYIRTHFLSLGCWQQLTTLQAKWF